MSIVRLSTRLKAERKARNMSQAELARRSGLSTGFISRLMSGEQGERVSRATLEALAGALEISVSELVIEQAGNAKISTVKSAVRAVPNTVPTPSGTFVPRRNITKQIHEALNTGHTSAIRQAAARAHGGYGKTVAAILYAHEYKDAYPGGRFFLSMEKQDIATALSSLGRFFGVATDAKPNAAAPLVKEALENAVDPDGKPAPSLLILDNIVDANQWDTITKSGLVPRGGCRVLVTTRAESIPQAKIVRVGRLTNEEAREVYKRFCALADTRDGAGRPPPSDATADAITSLVGGLAVAVAAVAARMKLRPDVAWADYAAMLTNLPIGSMPDASEEIRKEIGPAGQALAEHRRTLCIIDDALDALPAAERRAIEYAALLPEDMVPAPWLVWLLEQDAGRPAAREDGSTEPLKLSLVHEADIPVSPALRVVKHLDSMDVLLEKAESGKLLSLHRLWRQRVHERTQAAKLDISPLLRSVADCAAARRTTIIGIHPDGSDRGVDNPAALTDHSLRWELTPLAETCKGLWAAGHIGLAVRVGVWLVPILRQLGRYEEAVLCLQLSPATDAAVEAAIGQDGLAACYSNLAMIQQDQGDLPRARASMERAITIEENHLAPDHPTFASRFSNLATIQQDQGDLPGARASMERAITIAEKHLGNDHPLLANYLSNVAGILQAQGDLPGARASMERAIAINLKHFTPDHPTFASRFSNLATIQRDQGDLPGARASMERAIAIQHTHFAPDHPTFATRYSNLATIQYNQGDLPGARASMERAIAIQEKYFAPDHPTMAISWSNLATIQQTQGDVPGARASVERAIAIQQRHFAPDHPTFATSFNNLASICYAEGDLEAACANFKRALVILLKHFDENHPHVKAVRESMITAGCREDVSQSSSAEQPAAISLDAITSSGDQNTVIPEVETPNVITQGDALDAASKHDLQELFTKALSDVERSIIVQYYYREKTMREIGVMLDMSESRVSQMHSAILSKLKARMKRGAIAPQSGTVQTKEIDAARLRSPISLE